MSRRAITNTRATPRSSNNPLGTSVSAQSPGLPLDMLIQALKSRGPFSRLVQKELMRVSNSMEELRTWSDWDIRRDFSAALAGLCVLDPPLTGKNARPRNSNVVAASLLQEGDPAESWTLLCSGNNPLLLNDELHGTFFDQSIQKLKSISRAAHPHANDNLTSWNIRAGFQALAEAETNFILLAYSKHIPKIKFCVDKRGREIRDALRQFIRKQKIPPNDPIFPPLLQHIRDIIGIMERNAVPITDKHTIQQLHTAGRQMSILLRNSHACTALVNSQIRIKRKNPVEIIEKIATTAIQVNNLVVLAACHTRLGEVLEKLQNPTFINPSPHSGKFDSQKIKGDALRSRLASLLPRLELADNALWVSLNTVPIYRSPTTHIHCECTMAVHILEQGKPGKYYVGCPKLSCAPCFLFMQAVNEVGKHRMGEDSFEIFMDRTHGTWYLPWSIPPETPSDVYAAFETILLIEINNYLINTEDRGKLGSNSDAAVDIAPY